jgi:SagB-type dehydrogenase family enzyme
MVAFRGRVANLGHPSRGQSFALARLLERGDTEDALADLVVGESTPRMAEWYCMLGALGDIGAIEWVVRDGEEDLARLIPIGSGFRPELDRFDPHRPHALSSFAFLRRDGAHWSMESPLSSARVELPGRGAALLAHLPGGMSPEMIATGGLAAGLVESVLRLLAAAGFLGIATAEIECRGDESARAAGWSFHDALFHFRSRPGRHDAHVGVRPDAAPPVPLPRPRRHDPAARVELPLPNRAWIAAVDPPFSEVLERRRSRRSYDVRPIELEQLSELLFRTAADRSDASDPGTVRRTYPSGGGCYPLEIYAVAHRCRGLARAVYRYEPSAHALDRIPTPERTLDALLACYRGKAAQDEIQVLLLVTLVPERVNRRYGAIGYGLALKEVGGLFQSLYLVATAMGLAPCAVGTGDVEAAARALNLDPLQECAVGEFMIGSAPVITAESPPSESPE